MSGLLAKARAWLSERRSRPASAPQALGLTSPFTEGERVCILQAALAENGYKVAPTGVFDEATAAAVSTAKNRLRLDHTEDTAEVASADLLERLGLTARLLELEGEIRRGERRWDQ